MKFINNIKLNFPLKWPSLLILTFLIWVFSLKGFFTAKLLLSFDAVSYLVSIQYYIENLIKGIYPLWDPFLNSGVPTEFFLRRMGNYNPFLGLIALFKIMGFSFNQSYLLFLASYFFIGMVGFYKVSCIFFKSRNLAFLAYVLLLFSSLGTRLFDSFILLIFIPLIWFFYFLISFAIEPKKYKLAGLALSLMILLTTYIPFYFLNIFITFLIPISLFYRQEIVNSLPRIQEFLMKKKFYSLICLVAVSVSLIPGYQMFKDAKSGDFALPMRSNIEAQSSVIEVEDEKIKEGGLLTELAFAYQFNNLKFMNFRVLFVPLISILFLLLALGCCNTKRLWFLAVWLASIFVFSTTQSPIYEFFLNNVFYFKYFRNAHFFTWLVFLPCFILLTVECFDTLLKSFKKEGRMWQLIIVVGVHVLLLVFLFLRSEMLFTPYFIVTASLVTFILAIRKADVISFKAIVLLFSLYAVVQGVEVNYYLQKNSDQVTDDNPYLYNKVAEDFFYINEDVGAKAPAKTTPLTPVGKPHNRYYGLRNYLYLHNNINGDIFTFYKRYRFILYDFVQEVDYAKLDHLQLAKSFLYENNVAYIESYKQNSVLLNGLLNNKRFEPVLKDTAGFELLEFSSNTVKVRTNFNRNRFLVYNDNYYKGWNVSVNGNRVPLHQANYSFKGVALPRGENLIVFSYGSYKEHIKNSLIIMSFVLMLIFTLNGGLFNCLRNRNEN